MPTQFNNEYLIDNKILKDVVIFVCGRQCYKNYQSALKIKRMGDKINSKSKRKKEILKTVTALRRAQVLKLTEKLTDQKNILSNGCPMKCLDGLAQRTLLEIIRYMMQTMDSQMAQL